MKKHPGIWPKGVSGNPAGRKPGAERVRQLLEPKRDELINKAVELALAGDVTALRICIDRLAPPPRAEAAPIKIPGVMSSKTPAENARAIVGAAGKGLISTDNAAMMLGAIANAAKIIEVDELAVRIAALENADLV